MDDNEKKLKEAFIKAAHDIAMGLDYLEPDEELETIKAKHAQLMANNEDYNDHFCRFFESLHFLQKDVAHIQEKLHKQSTIGFALSMAFFITKNTPNACSIKYNEHKLWQIYKNS